MTIVSALKNLAKKMTGKDAAGETIDEVLESFAGDYAAELPAVTTDDNGDILKVTAGAWAKAPAELPAVTADDNGDILKVAGGAWTKADAPADKSPLVVTGTADGSTVTITETLTNIKTAFDAGRSVYLVVNGMRCSCVVVIETGESICAQFTLTFYDSDDSAAVNMAIDFAGTQTGTLTQTVLAAAQA